MSMHATGVSIQALKSDLSGCPQWLLLGSTVHESDGHLPSACLESQTRPE